MNASLRSLIRTGLLAAVVAAGSVSAAGRIAWSPPEPAVVASDGGAVAGAAICGATSAKRDGGACSSGDECSSGTCEGGSCCTAHGDTCDDSSHCCGHQSCTDGKCP